MRLALAAALLALPACAHRSEPAATPVSAAQAPAAALAEAPTPATVLAAAPASAWKRIEPADLLVMDLAPDAAGKPRRVIVQLVPPPFSQGWVENIRTLAKAHWWDGTSVYRVVDNWVAQWGDADEAKPLPEGLRVVPESDYVAQVKEGDPLSQLKLLDAYSQFAIFRQGWPIGVDYPTVHSMDITGWPTHCYASVGVARSTDSTGTGSELYAVIGHAPRQLDRNLAVVGRVIEGIEHLSTLPRGPAETNGVYEDATLRVPIVAVRLGNEVAEVPQPQFEYLASESESFTEYVHVRANRQDSFYKVPAGGIDVCNVQVPIRRVPAE